jgi:aspartate aminotransferase/aspartate/glutamate/aspartate-prephenate aminotransferase
MVDAFRKRRDYMLTELGNIEGIVCPKPEGAFYLFPDISHYFGTVTPDGIQINSSEDLTLYLLESHYVALVPGEAFGGPDGLRISYAAAMDDLQEAMSRIKKGLALLEPAMV